MAGARSCPYTPDPLITGLVEKALGRERPLRMLRVQGSAGAFLLASLRRQYPGPILAISPTLERAERLAADLRAFAGDASARIFPPYDTLPFDRFSPHPEIEARRMSFLYQLLAAGDATPLTLVAPWAALLRRVPSRAELRSRVTHLERGMTVDRDALLQVLVAAGYHHSRIVEERGEVAARGGIVDLFPPQLDSPVRLEFAFEEIESIRRFDPSTQRSRGELREIVAIPPRAYRLPSDVDPLLHEVRSLGKARGLPESNIYAITEPLARHRVPPGVESLEALLHDGLETVFDYLPGDTLIAVDDPEAGRAASMRYTEEVYQGHAKALSQDRLVCDPLSLYMTDDTAWDVVRARKPLLFDAIGVPDPAADEENIEVNAIDHRELRREIKEHRGSGRALKPLAERLSRWREQGRRVSISCTSLSSAERLVDILRGYGHELPISSGAKPGEAATLPDPGCASLSVGSLTAGFELALESLVLLTEQDIFGARLRRPAARVTRRGQAIDRLAQIQEDDLLVHAEHGIGRYGGLVQLNVGGIQQELLLVHYGKTDKLYLPISRMSQIQRYTGADDHTPSLDRLGGLSWTRARKRVRHAVREMAAELLAVIAAREVLEGHACPAPGTDYEEFEAGFPYEDTPDQQRATLDVLGDLQAARPMDRLICGDVGFGKTEIACRAAYVIASAGRQVAFLVPTTVLCQQHLQTLRERFADTPVEIGALSRLSSTKDAREVREGLASGRLDVVVGTHRLLAKDLHFRNLGLIVVDEEHRFGVVHKERLKQLRKLVDVMTLTATPIPRTLQLAFTGLRDLSVISTPPPDRIAIRTQACAFDEDVVRDALLRELNRGGQAFFVHNRVETIQEIGEYLRRLVPSARIEVVHGQMPGPRLEGIMLDFVERKFDVLVCTAIIESGLDIANANTILIHRADRFGLAQLYQLRGRVGRSDRRAHAYLFLPPEGSMTRDARRRVEAIQDLAELGAGFRLATEDLEIRGAGNLLGSEQSGHIASVGYDLYMEMLEKAISELRGEGVEEVLDPEIRLPIAALLPESFVPDANQRLVIYKQLSSARDDAELAEVRADILDRFGSLPPEAESLIELIRLKTRCRRLGIESVDHSRGELVFKLGERARIEPRQLIALLDEPSSPLRVSPDHRIFLDLRGQPDPLAVGARFLEQLDREGSTQQPGPAEVARPGRSE